MGGEVLKDSRSKPSPSRGGVGGDGFPHPKSKTRKKSKLPWKAKAGRKSATINANAQCDATRPTPNTSCGSRCGAGRSTEQNFGGNILSATTFSISHVLSEESWSSSMEDNMRKRRDTIANGHGCWSARALPCCGSRSEEHTSELQSLMRNSYAVLCLKKKK